MEFKVGDKAVYPAHGVAEIKCVEAREMGGHLVDCYILNILSSGATVMVPVAATKRAGIRVLSSAHEIAEVFKVMRMPAKISPRTWNKRYREFNEKLRTGSVCDVAEVFRDLRSLQHIKGLSYGEKQMLEKSKDLVVSELSAAKNVPALEIESEINQMFAAH